MIQDRVKGIVACQQLIEAAVVQLLFWAGYAVLLCLGSVSASDWKQYADCALVMLLGMIGHNLARESGQLTSPRLGLMQSHYRASRLTLSVLAGLVLLYFISAQFRPHVGFVATVTVGVYLAALATNRWFVRTIIDSIYASHRDLTIALGDESDRTGWHHWIDDQRNLGLEVIHFHQLVEWHARAGVDEQAPFLAILEEVAEKHRVAQLLLLSFPEQPQFLRDLVAFCNRRGIRMLVSTNLHEAFGHSVSLFNHNGLQFISLRNEPLENPINRIMKRGLDIIVASVGLLITMPILLPVVWLLQRWQSSGTLFCVQVRAGLRNGRFRMFKFRTMHANNEEAKQACSNDPRVFPAGRFLRNSSLDEIPQLWNVLKGEMSLVGPRPHLINHNEAFEKILLNYNVRTLVLPGLTGLAQIRGHRGETPGTESIERRVAADIYYIENWSMTMDILILARTFLQVICPPTSAK